MSPRTRLSHITALTGLLTLALAGAAAAAPCSESEQAQVSQTGLWASLHRLARQNPAAFKSLGTNSRGYVPGRASRRLSPAFHRDWPEIACLVAAAKEKYPGAPQTARERYVLEKWLHHRFEDAGYARPAKLSDQGYEPAAPPPATTRPATPRFLTTESVIATAVKPRSTSRRSQPPLSNLSGLFGLPTASRPASRPAYAPAGWQAPSLIAATPGTIYRIRSGDTLGHIAQAYRPNLVDDGYSLWGTSAQGGLTAWLSAYLRADQEDLIVTYRAAVVAGEPYDPSEVFEAGNFPLIAGRRIYLPTEHELDEFRALVTCTSEGYSREDGGSCWQDETEPLAVTDASSALPTGGSNSGLFGLYTPGITDPLATLDRPDASGDFWNLDPGGASSTTGPVTQEAAPEPPRGVTAECLETAYEMHECF
jgi:hypothetical protein